MHNKKIELSEIRKDDGCVGYDNCESGVVEFDATANLRKIVSYKLVDKTLLKKIETRLTENSDLIFCGFELETEYDVMFHNESFLYSSELRYLNGCKNYLSKRINNRFWVTYLLNYDNNCDVIDISVPANKGFVLPKVTAKFVKYRTWTTGCLFSKRHYSLVNDV